MVKPVLAAFLFLALAVCIGRPGMAETRTQARFVMKVLGTNVAEIRIDGTVSDARYAVDGRLATTGVVSALVDVLYVGRAQGRRAGSAFRPQRYSETVVEGKARKSGALAFRGGVPHPEGYKAEERGPDALPIEGQSDTVDPLTAIFMVLRDQSDAEVCKLRQFVFDGERRTHVDFTRAAPASDGLTCTGTFRRIAGYPHDKHSKRRKVVPMTVHYRRNGDLYQVTEVRMQSDYGAAVLRRR